MSQWAEFTEWIVDVQSPRSSFSETAFHKWLEYWKLGKSAIDMALVVTLTNFYLGLNKIGGTVYYPLLYKPMLLEIGFKNVTERKYAGESRLFLSCCLGLPSCRTLCRSYQDMLSNLTFHARKLFSCSTALLGGGSSHTRGSTG